MNTITEIKNETDINPTTLAIWEVFQQFTMAIANGDAHAVANCYCEDAQFMIPNRVIVVGRNNIEKAFIGYISQGLTQYQCTSLKVYGSTGIVGTENTYTLSKPGGKNQEVGKAVHLWKTENGYWKIYRDCFNSDLPVMA